MHSVCCSMQLDILDWLMMCAEMQLPNGSEWEDEDAMHAQAEIMDV